MSKTIHRQSLVESLTHVVGDFFNSGRAFPKQLDVMLEYLWVA